MRKLVVLLVIGILFTAGCAYNKTTQLKVKGDEIVVPLQGIGTIKGKNIEGTLNRSVSMVAEKKRKHTVKNEVADTKGSITVE